MMRLKRHRADVKYLSNGEWIYPQYAKIIAKRYLNLIGMAEGNWNMTDSYFTYKERVLKDSEK